MAQGNMLTPRADASTATTPASARREHSGEACSTTCTNCGSCRSKGRTAPPRMRVAVGIATLGRPSVLLTTLMDLALQDRPADVIYVSFSKESDLGDARQRFPRIHFLQSEVGLTRQRNRILEEVVSDDLLIFLDDDFHLRSDYIQLTERVFLANPDVAVATGMVVMDGINGPGLAPFDARLALQRTSDRHDSRLKRAFNAYGCNMCLRLAPIHEHRLRFDEKLPLYGWYEDVDFSRRLGLYGSVVQITGAFGVHLGVKNGRQSGVRLGYSQIANPVYLARKMSVPWRFAIASMLSRSCKNIVRSLKPEPFVDRRGRLRGNLLGWKDLLQGRIHPGRILTL